MFARFLFSAVVFTMFVCHSYGITITISATPSTICTGDSAQLNAGASGGTAPYVFSWTSNPPGFISASPIVKVSPNFTTWYIVTVTDNSLITAKDSVLVTVNSIPLTPGYINGLTETCRDSASYYYIDEVAGATYYTWTVPPDAVVENGQTTSVVYIHWGSTSGNLSVVAGNNCGTSDPDVKSVIIYSPPPTPGNITGSPTACKYSYATFSIGDVLTASAYTWTVPPDADIMTGQGFKTIIVHWGESDGAVTVTASNFCGKGSASSKSITTEIVPSAAGSITGNDQPCKGRNGYQYSVGDIPGATGYNWTLPNGASINGAKNDKQIMVDYSDSAVSGSITVKGHNSCGDGTESIITVIINECSGIGENEKNNAFFIFPNPVVNKLNIGFRRNLNDLEISITDLNGKEKLKRAEKSVTTGANKQVDLSGFAPGIYILKLHFNDQFFYKKVVIQ